MTLNRVDGSPSSRSVALSSKTILDHQSTWPTNRSRPSNHADTLPHLSSQRVISIFALKFMMIEYDGLTYCAGPTKDMAIRNCQCPVVQSQLRCGVVTPVVKRRIDLVP